MNIDEIRRKTPALIGLDDATVLDVIHQTYYSDMPKEALAQRLGYKPEVKTEDRSLLRTAGDYGISALKGAIGVPEAAVGLADMVTGGYAGKTLEEAGFRPKDAKAFLDQQYSDQQKEAFQNVQQAEGFGGKFVAALQNPSVIAHSVVESLAPMGVGALAGRGVMALAPRVGRAIAAGAGEGIVGAGSAAEQIRQETPGGLLSGGQTGLAVMSGAATFAFGALGNKVAKSLGIADIDTMMLGVAKNPAAAKGIVRRLLEGAASEGILEELPQSISEQAIQNIALGKPIEEGIDQAAVMGLLSGAAMGGGANVFSGGNVEPMVQPPAQTPPPVTTPNAPIAQTVGTLPNKGALTRAANAIAPVATGPLTNAAKALTPEQADQIAMQLDKAAAEAGQGIPADVNPDTGEVGPSAYEVRQADAPKSEPGDILNAMNEPFKSQFSAKRIASQMGDGFQAFQIGPKQFVVRKVQPDVSTSTPIDPVDSGSGGQLGDNAAGSDSVRGRVPDNATEPGAQPAGEILGDGQQDAPVRVEQPKPAPALSETGQTASDASYQGYLEREREQRRKEDQDASNKQNNWAKRATDWFTSANDGDSIEDTGTGVRYVVRESAKERKGKRFVFKSLFAVSADGTETTTGITMRDGVLQDVGKAGIDEDGIRFPTSETFGTALGLGKGIEDGTHKTSRNSKSPAETQAAPSEAPASAGTAAAAKAVPAAPGSAPVEAAGVADGPGSDVGNGFKRGPQEGERYRVGVSSATGGVTIEKRLPAGTVATFYVGKDGGLIDADDVNLVGTKDREKLWIPPNKETADQVTAILDGMGKLALSDPKRRAAKEQLKALVTRSSPVEAAGLKKPGPGGSLMPVKADLTTAKGLEVTLQREFSGKYNATIGGEPAGSVVYTDTPSGGFRVTGIDVDPKFRRKGVASAIYDFLEKDVTGQPLAESGGQSEDGIAFRRARASKVEAAGVVDANPVPDNKPSEPANYGTGHRLLTEGGKPFKTKRAADDAKRLQPMMRVKKVKGGYVLTEKTPAQIAAQARAAARLAAGSTGDAGMPQHAHGFMAREGGLSKETMSDLGLDRNQRIGSMWLFKANGGMTLEQATEKFVEGGYLKEGASHSDAINLIKKSITTPQYTADGWERIAQAEADARFEDHLAAQEESAQNEDFDPFASSLDEGFDLSDIDGVGYDEASDPIKLEVNALLAHAESLGIDTESIRENEYENTKNGSEQDYFEAFKRALASAIEAGNRDSSPDSGEQGNAAGENPNVRSGVESPGEAVAQSSGKSLEAGQKDIDLAKSLTYKLPYLEQRLVEGLDPTDGFDMHILANSLPESIAYNRMMMAHNGDFQGIEFKKEDSERYAFVLPDASNPGSWRVSYFDKNGFSRHESEPTREKAQQTLAIDGFTVEDKGALDRFAETKEWAIGTAFGDLIMQLNKGMITHAQFLDLQQKLNSDVDAQKQDSSDNFLVAPSREDILARQQAEQDAAKAKEKADKEQEEKDRAERIQKEIDARQRASAENFILGQNAEDALAGQGDVFNQPEQPAAQATAILDAAEVKGKERIDVLKDVKAGTITPEEVKAAYPPKVIAQETTDAQKEQAENHAKNLGGRVVWQNGDIALIEGFSALTGDSVYVATNGESRTRVDIRSYTGNVFSEKQKAELLKAREDSVKASDAEIDRNPNGPFADSSVVFADDIPSRVQGIVRSWIAMLGLDGTRIVVTTPESGAQMADGLAGRFRRIGKANLSGDNTNGVMQPLGGNDFHIAVRAGTSILKTLEILAHELGHIVERTEFANANEATKQKIQAAHAQWMKENGSGSALDMAKSMRAYRSGMATGFNEVDSAAQASGYWKSFGEWFADQVSRWATTQEKPVGVVSQFFKRLADKLKSFFVGEKEKFLPNATVTEWLNSLSKDAPLPAEVAAIVDEKPGAANETDVVFSTGAPVAPGKGISLRAAKNIAEKVLNDLGIGSIVKLEVVRNPAEAGISVPSGVVPTGGTGNGKVHIFADNIADESECFRVIFHELFHLGLSQSVGTDQYNQAMLKFLSDPLVVKYAKEWKQSADGQSRKGKMPANNFEALAVEESLATIGELLNTDQKGLGSIQLKMWVRRAITALADFAQKIGLVSISKKLRAMTYTEAEKFIQSTILKAKTGAPVLLRDTRFSDNGSGTYERNPFYSALAKGIQNIGVNAAPAGGWKDAIKGLVNKGIAKADEVEWSGLNDWLDLQTGKVQKADLLAFMDAHGVKVEETVLGLKDTAPRFFEWLESLGYTEATASALDSEKKQELTRQYEREHPTPKGTKYDRYILPGGENYREVLLTLPVKAKQNVLEARKTPYGYWEAWNHTTGESEQDGGEQEVKDYVAETSRNLAAPIATADYKSSHWDQANVLAHIRVNDRTDADGKRVLFVEEIQSDWGQQGKKDGFGGGNHKAGEKFTVMRNGDARSVTALKDTANSLTLVEDENGSRFNVGAGEGVPRAPFVTKTDAWLNLALKRIITMAVDGGYDRVAFVNGQQSADRYDLSKQIDHIDYRRNPRSDDTYDIAAVSKDGREVLNEEAAKLDYIEELVGKEIAQKIANGEGQQGGGRTTLRGLDLKVGGEGMITFYDRIVPNAVNALLKKVGGGKLEKISASTESKYPKSFSSEKQAEDWANKNLGNHDFTVRGLSESSGTFGVYDEYTNKMVPDDAMLNQPGFIITDALREKASEGLPLFRSVPNNPKAYTEKANQTVKDLFNAPGSLSWWHKSVGTMHNLANRSPQFKRVFDSVQEFLGDVSFYATEAADLAPTLLPKLENWRDIFKSPISAGDTKAIAAPIFEGTLTWMRDESGKAVKLADQEEKYKDLNDSDKASMLLRKRVVTEQQLKRWLESPLDIYHGAVRNRFEQTFLSPGIVFSDAELKGLFNLTPNQIGLYREFRAATDKSLNNMAISEMLRYGGKDVDGLGSMVMDAPDADTAAKLLADHLKQLAEEDPDRAVVLINTAATIKDKADKITKLTKQGYAPLSRFGHYTVDVLDEEGERAYFGMFESKGEANRMARQMRANYPQGTITQGTVSEQAYKMFSGITPETLELFGEMVGLEGDDARAQMFQEYLKLAKSNRSAMKRLIHRKGIAGFSEDAGRVLAGFVYSNARLTSTNLHTGEITKATADISKSDGELKDTAIKLADYVRNPQEEAQAIRGMLFAQYLGGSLASAMVNMTQPFTVTMPYLSQWGGAVKSANRMRSALSDAIKKTTGDVRLDAALKRAEEEGIVSPQEVHSLMAQARGQGALQSGDGTIYGDARAKAGNALSKFGLAWGRPFAIAEQFNRRITFIAAYRTAIAEGIANPAKFAEKAIQETQFVYNKGNRPSWARGAVGSTLFTFKQYSISYAELLHRMSTQGGPEGKKAALFALAMMFLAAGAGGLPFMGDAEDIIDGIAQRLGYSFSTKQARRQFLIDSLGSGAADFVERGVSGLPGVPIDVAGRLGMSNLIPGTGLLTKKPDHTRDVLEFAGPAGDFIKRGFEGAESIVSGEVVKGVATMAPKAVANAKQAFDMYQTGMYRDQKDRKVIDVDGYDALAKAIGFQPVDVARVQDATGVQQNLIGQNKMMKSSLAEDMAKAIFEKDADKQQEIRESMQKWNKRNPESPVTIDMVAVRRRLREMNLTKAERVEKSAPKAIRADVKRALSESPA